VAERRRRLRHIESAGQHLLSLIDDVLDLSSLEGGELPFVAKPVPLRALVNDTLPQLEALAQRHGVTLHTGALVGVPMADEKRLRQVLLNLLSNAIKYNREGGEVHIGAEGDGDAVRLHITDTGVGMSAEQLEHAFEPFNRLGRENAGIEGTGIGLPIVKALVEHMGGSVEVHSRVGLGTRFEVRLPAAPPDATPTQDATPPPPAPLATGRAARLLYIEDNPVNVLIVKGLVALRANTTLHIATTGLGGVQQAVALDPDLVLVDIHLPDIDGFEVLRRLRALPQTARTVCVMLSANAMPDVIQRALRAGFAAYWTKPLDFARFQSGLDELLGG